MSNFTASGVGASRACERVPRGAMPQRIGQPQHLWQSTVKTNKSLPPHLACGLPLGAPPGRYAIHPFPAEMQPARYFSMALHDKPKQITFFSEGVRPAKKEKVRSREQRTTEVQIDFGVPVIPLRAYLGGNASIFFIYGRIFSPLILRAEILQPKEATLITYYETLSGRKILHAFFVAGTHPPADIGWALVGFDHFYAIDTNTLPAPDGRRLSVTAVVEGVAKRLADGYSFTDIRLVHREAHIDVEGNPELHALRCVVEQLAVDHPPESGRRIGMITDTEYSKLKEISFRRQPLHGDYYLPPNFDVFYATSDSGSTEYMPNKMMRICDKAAGDALAHAIETYPGAGR
jgi:hypothetical protein